ncbi:MAG: cell division/cell wall cluster transcriptional repressor MraZ [Ardenticatenales bacterium]|nr:cell division/cell wall cluster transcriptional repressor MraZ [Ardenticatenales bacterium]
MSAWDLDGELRCSIDDKGRVIIPKPFREPFEAGLHMIRGLSGKCLWLFPLDEWPAQRAALLAHLTAGAGAVDAVRFLRTGFAETPDRQGRAMIPAPLRDHCGLKPNSAVAALGMGHRLELWSAELWQKQAVDVIGQVAEIMAAADLAAMRGDAEPTR